MRNSGLAALALLTVSAESALAASMPSPLAVAQDVDLRAEQTLDRMTLAEKLTLLRGFQPHQMPETERPKSAPLGAGYVPGVERLGVPVLWGLEFGHCAAQLTIPLGVPAVLDTKTATVELTVPGLA